MTFASRGSGKWRLTESLPNEPGTDGISDVVVNTLPSLS